MIVKIHSRGTGGGASPVKYLAGSTFEVTREGATLDRGDLQTTVDLINSSPYAQKYTSGVLSFAEADLDRTQKDAIMSSFEEALLPGLDKNQYSVLWVEHKDKDRLELNFVVPNIELQSGKRLQPYYDRADRPRINAWKNLTNDQYGLHDPNDPINRRELCTPRDLPKNKQLACEAITRALLLKTEKGQIKNRNDVLTTLEESGFTIARQTKKSISIADPDGGKNIRLKGLIYEQDFRFSEELRGEIERASAAYRASREERVRENESIYQRGIEIKSAANRERYTIPNIAYQKTAPQELDMGPNNDHRLNISPMGSNRVPEPSNQSKTKPVKRDEYDYGFTGKKRGFDGHSNLPGYEEKATPLHQNKSLSGQLSEWLHDTDGVLENDRVRKDVIAAIKADAERQREQAQRVQNALRQFSQDVSEYQVTERGVTGANQQLERANTTLEKLVDEKQLEKQLQRSYGFHR